MATDNKAYLMKEQMSYKVIYPKRLQIFPTKTSDELVGSLVIDWQHYGFYTRGRSFNISLKKILSHWKVTEMPQEEIGDFYIADFKNALNCYIENKFIIDQSENLINKESKIYFFENVLFDVSKNKEKFIYSNLSEQPKKASITKYFLK